LNYEIRDKKQIKSVEQDIAHILRTRFKNKSGIIYCISRKDCERLSEKLKKNYGIKCDYYHAELEYEKRAEIQAKWMSNKI
jgi:bloom syndrome protein